MTRRLKKAEKDIATAIHTLDSMCMDYQIWIDSSRRDLDMRLKDNREAVESLTAHLRDLEHLGGLLRSIKAWVKRNAR